MGFFSADPIRIYDIIFLVLSTLFVVLFLYKKRKKLEREGILFLYRTQVGIKIISYIGKKYSGFLRFIEYIVIATGYALMIAMIYILLSSLRIFLNPAYVQAIKIPPLAPLIPYLPEIFKVDFLPPFYFTYWIIALAIVAIVHEFSHGIFARLHNIKIKSTGFGFLGPFLAAFVEPDEKKMQKLKTKNQLSILGAGTFANVIMTVLFFLLMWFFFYLSFSASGAIFNNYVPGIVNVSDISGIGNNFSVNYNGGLNLTEIYSGNKTYLAETKSLNKAKLGDELIVFENLPAIRAGLNGVIVNINNAEIKNYEDIGTELAKYSPGERINVKALQKDKTIRDYEIILTESPDNSSKAYLGIAIYQDKPSLFGKIRRILTFFKDPNTYYSPKAKDDLIVFIYNLLWWIVLINISVALVNMLPVGIFDGGRFFYLTMGYFFGERTGKILFKIATYMILGIFLLLMIFWGVGFFGR